MSLTMKEKWERRIIPFLMETLGGILVAVALDSFFVNAEFPLTGFSGIALIFNRLFGLPLGATIVVLNIPLALLCYKLLGKGFFFRSIRCMIISSFFIDYIGPMFPAYDGDRLLAALCTGVIMGIGYALIYMQNSSTGGADFMVMALKSLHPHLSLGKLVFLTDFVIVMAGGILFGWCYLRYDRELYLLRGDRQGDVRCKCRKAHPDRYRPWGQDFPDHRGYLSSRFHPHQGGRRLQQG